ncbi:helix-turn-helix domain-containing protein [Rhizobium sp. L1K21]|uniref:helix-turn-helix domain-containing protein n=1 Tax=Rhizobium sp. L1K21 TaxID=2954933 RepID=UPI0020920726|nr:helix-turn-helix domain-containing protein [Rhizobium sp. L1K21]MCO6185586.1 helix-turn-helix domain-containing protein [Rhizobium sp. L1K21]
MQKDIFSEQTPGLPHQSFDSRGLTPEAAFDGWRSAVAPVFDVAPVHPDQPFAATYDTYHLGDMLVGLGTFGPTTFTRSREKSRIDGIDYLLVQVYTSGGYSGHLDDRPITVQPMEPVTLDMAREARTVSLASSNITVLIPRDLVKSRVFPHGHMNVGLRGAALGGLLADHLVALARSLPTMPLSAGAAAASATLAMYEAALDPAEALQQAGTEPFREALFQRARRFIDDRIGSGKIDIASLASELGLSRSSLYRMFEPYRGVESFITDRRLAHARKALTDPHDIRRIGIIAAACGFDDHSSFSRLFKRRYGVTPAELRSRGRLARPGDSQEVFDLQSWIADVT